MFTYGARMIEFQPFSSESLSLVNLQLREPMPALFLLTGLS